MNKKNSCVLRNVLRNVWLFLLVNIFFAMNFFHQSNFWLRNENSKKNFSRYLCFWKCDEKFWLLFFETPRKCYLNQIQRIFFVSGNDYILTSAWVQTTEKWKNQVNTHLLACHDGYSIHTVHLNWNTNSLEMNVDCFSRITLYGWNICGFFSQIQWHTKFSTINVYGAGGSIRRRQWISSSFFLRLLFWEQTNQKKRILSEI